MERKVPSTASEEIELYLRTIYSLLRSTTEVQIRTLEEVHAGTNSLLHPEARNEAPDTSAFVYVTQRLPACMPYVRSVILGQSTTVFAAHGFADVESWQEVTARARRRRCMFNQQDTLACFIASRSDIEDVIPALTAYQIEWNKLHLLLRRCPADCIADATPHQPEAFARLAEILNIPVDDLQRLWVIWGDGFTATLQMMRERRCDLRVLLLDGSLTEYWRATRNWLDNIARHAPDLADRPVYFVSSNPHSPANLLSGFALQNEAALVPYLHQVGNRDLLEEWFGIENRELPSNRANFLYYILKKFQATPEGQELIEAQRLAEQSQGITRIFPAHSFDIEAQVIELNRLDAKLLDPRLQDGDLAYLRQSDALILNIDYPLGLAAYNILARVAEHTGKVLGVYIMGKAATLNGVRGDVMIPNVVQDEHSENTYLFQNAFSAADVQPYLAYGTVMDNQKAVTVLGTFLQNARIMDVMYREGYTDIEMEAGPYLSAIYEMTRPKRHPVNEIINLYGIRFDLGILHYASDTPLSKGKNLGAGTLSYMGMDSTYACSAAILRRIFHKEKKRLAKNIT